MEEYKTIKILDFEDFFNNDFSKRFLTQEQIKALDNVLKDEINKIFKKEIEDA